MCNEMKITFPGGKRVNAHYGDFVVETDQPPASGGEGSAPEPFDIFLAGIGTCVGCYIVTFCLAREIPTEGMSMTQRWERNDERAVVKVTLELRLPAGFPDKYRQAVLRAANSCAVKRTLAAQPQVVLEIAE